MTVLAENSLSLYLFVIDRRKVDSIGSWFECDASVQREIIKVNKASDPFPGTGRFGIFAHTYSQIIKMTCGFIFVGCLPNLMQF